MTKKIEKLTQRLDELNTQIDKDAQRLEVLKAREQLAINKERNDARKKRRIRAHKLITLGAAVSAIFPQLVELDTDEKIAAWGTVIAKEYKASDSKSALKLARVGDRLKEREKAHS